MSLYELLHSIITRITPIEYGGTGAITAENAAKNLGYGKVLLSTAVYMNASQTMTLSEAVSAQPHGIVLVWSAYSSGALNHSWNYHFVPKNHVSAHNGTGVSFLLVDGSGAAMGRKYVYISNTSVAGSDYNTSASTTSGSGITWKNNYYVLRYVIGV